MTEREDNFFSDTNRRIDADLYRSNIDRTSHIKTEKKKLKNDNRIFRITILVTIILGILTIIATIFFK